MSSPVISVEHLSKAYRIGVKEEIPDTLMGAMKNVITAPWKNFRALRRLNTSTDSPIPNPLESDTLWALRDVSFEINRGEVVGIIGRNGAGKSTLLKVLSRITEPTSGRVIMRGRVSSLLEVGTGFHPELTGRENVYMNGTILGMRKKEIDRKFDEIVDFSGVEKFLDTPTKRYSSGMQVRLAFAVAAHLEPEILIVDEVLAVGDAEFQNKCIGKMQDVAKGGRTVLFVSHNMPAVERLCRTGLHINSGRCECAGPIKDVISHYKTPQFVPINSPVRDHSGIIADVYLATPDGKRQSDFTVGSSLVATMRIRCTESLLRPKIAICFDDAFGERALTVFAPTGANQFRSLSGEVTITCAIEHLPLIPGHYTIKAVLIPFAEVSGISPFTITNTANALNGSGYHAGSSVAESSWSVN